jgi:hypothetical protein
MLSYVGGPIPRCTLQCTMPEETRKRCGPGPAADLMSMTSSILISSIRSVNSRFDQARHRMTFHCHKLHRVVDAGRSIMAHRASTSDHLHLRPLPQRQLCTKTSYAICCGALINLFVLHVADRRRSVAREINLRSLPENSLSVFFIPNLLATFAFCTEN